MCAHKRLVSSFFTVNNPMEEDPEHMKDKMNTFEAGTYCICLQNMYHHHDHSTPCVATMPQ